MKNATYQSSSTALAIAGSSSDSADTFRIAHAAAESALGDVGPSSRVSALYEAQLARALNESRYDAWSEDDKKREEVCNDLTASMPALMDVDRAEQ